MALFPCLAEYCSVSGRWCGGCGRGPGANEGHGGQKSRMLYRPMAKVSKHKASRFKRLDGACSAAAHWLRGKTQADRRRGPSMGFGRLSSTTATAAIFAFLLRPERTSGVLHRLRVTIISLIS